jgi:hypothetical protein
MRRASRAALPAVAKVLFFLLLLASFAAAETTTTSEGDGDGAATTTTTTTTSVSPQQQEPSSPSPSRVSPLPQSGLEKGRRKRIAGEQRKREIAGPKTAALSFFRAQKTK